VREVDGERQFYVQEASTEMYAGLKSAIAGFEGDLKEVIPLDAKTAKKLPKDLVGRVVRVFVLSGSSPSAAPNPPPGPPVPPDSSGCMSGSAAAGGETAGGPASTRRGRGSGTPGAGPPIGLPYGSAASSGA
jgi:hypothetical protein